MSAPNDTPFMPVTVSPVLSSNQWPVMKESCTSSHHWRTPVSIVNQALSDWNARTQLCVMLLYCWKSLGEVLQLYLISVCVCVWRRWYDRVRHADVAKDPRYSGQWQPCKLCDINAQQWTDSCSYWYVVCSAVICGLYVYDTDTVCHCHGGAVIWMWLVDADCTNDCCCWWLSPSSSIWPHLSYDLVRSKREYYQNCSLVVFLCSFL